MGKNNNVTEMIKSVNAMMKATKADKDDIKDMCDEIIAAQEAKNKMYNKFLGALTTGTDAISAEAAKLQLSDLGISKVDDMNAFAKTTKRTVTDQLNAETESCFYKTMESVVRLNNQLEAEKPKSDVDKLIEVLLLQQTGGRPYPAASTYPTVPAYDPNANAAIANEKARLNREKESKISEIRALKKSGSISALEMAQAIAGVNSEYKAKLGNI